MMPGYALRWILLALLYGPALVIGAGVGHRAWIERRRRLRKSHFCDECGELYDPVQAAKSGRGAMAETRVPDPRPEGGR